MDTVLPSGFPTRGFLHQAFEQLLTQFINDQGRVNYHQWSQDKRALKQLDEYLAAVAKFSPENAPERFNHRSGEAIVYWVTT